MTTPAQAPVGPGSDQPAPAGQPGPAPAGSAQPAAAPAGQASAPVQGPGVSPSPQEPDQTVTQLQAQLAQSRQTINRLQGQVSASDQARHQADERYRSSMNELNSRLRELEVSGLDENERAAYDAQYYRSQAEQALAEKEQAEYDALYWQRTNQWYTYYQQQGIPAQALNASSLEALHSSATQFAMSAYQRHQQSQSQPSQPPAPQDPQAPIVPTIPGMPNTNRPIPPNVPAPQAGPAPGRPRWSDIPYEQWGDWYRRFEQGQISESQMPI